MTPQLFEDRLPVVAPVESLLGPQLRPSEHLEQMSSRFRFSVELQHVRREPAREV